MLNTNSPQTGCARVTSPCTLCCNTTSLLFLQGTALRILQSAGDTSMVRDSLHGTGTRIPAAPASVPSGWEAAPGGTTTVS